MSTFAKVLDGTVIDVIVAKPDYFETFVDTSPGTWLETDPNTKGGIHYGPNGQPDGGIALRGNYAGIGYVYNYQEDVFYPQRPKDMNGLVCKSWTISAPTWTWEPPVPFPDTTDPCVWDETTQSWIPIALAE
jgi:hypothetical protein